MVRAVLQDGAIQPLDPLPVDWHEGQTLIVDLETAVQPEEVSAWAHEIEEAARKIPDEDHDRFLKALDDQKKASKELVRRQMGLPG